MLQEQILGFAVICQNSKTQMPWTNTWQSSVHRSDCMVITSQFDIPFVICKVILDSHQSNHYQFDAWSSDCYCTSRPDSSVIYCTLIMRFFLVAIYMNADMVHHTVYCNATWRHFAALRVIISQSVSMTTGLHCLNELKILQVSTSGPWGSIWCHYPTRKRCRQMPTPQWTISEESRG